jgi:transcriptional regulator with XRE-family HTH domain
MTSRMHPERLDRELARRGWNATDLAKASGICVATISGARRGRPVSNSTLCKIVIALREAPVIPGVDDLLGPVEGLIGDGQQNRQIGRHVNRKGSAHESINMPAAG